MAELPIVLLDVDGVLNAVCHKVPAGYHRFRSQVGYEITWRPEVTARIRGWHEQGLAEVQWLTTWEDNADAFLAEQLGLPRGLHTHVGRDRYAGPPAWWKLKYAMEAVATGRPVVWLDDDLHHGYDPELDAFLDSHNPADQQLLAVRPSMAVGLSDEQLDTIEVWLRALPTPAPADTAEVSS